MSNVKKSLANLFRKIVDFLVPESKEPVLIGNVIAYAEYVAQYLQTNIDYSNYLADKLETAIERIILIDPSAAGVFPDEPQEGGEEDPIL